MDEKNRKMSAKSLKRYFHSKYKTKRILTFAITHFVVSMLALFCALEGLGAIDDPLYEPSRTAITGDIIFKSLMFPAIELKDFSLKMGVVINDFFEWVLVVGNSIAYALFFDYLILKLLGRRNKGIPFSEDEVRHE